MLGSGTVEGSAFTSVTGLAEPSLILAELSLVLFSSTTVGASGLRIFAEISC